MARSPKPRRMRALNTRSASSCALLALAWALARPALADAGANCADQAVEPEIQEALRSRHFLDAHLLARTAAALCPAAAPRYRTYDAIALMELDETARAREVLQLVTRTADPLLKERAQVLGVFSYLRERDEHAFTLALDRLPLEARARLIALEAADDPARFTSAARGLPAGLGDVAAAAVQSLWEAQTVKRPWLAATMSVVVPGAGQAYAGSWQGAAVAFFLNAALIAATAELAYKRMYLTATAAGVAASFFYVGNIINAADLARRRNEIAASPARLALERRLVPEAFP
jgi:hypothetical protein